MNTKEMIKKLREEEMTDGMRNWVKLIKKWKSINTTDLANLNVQDIRNNLQKSKIAMKNWTKLIKKWK